MITIGVNMRTLRMVMECLKLGRRFSPMPADINNLYILNPKNLRSSASKIGFPILSSSDQDLA